MSEHTPGPWQNAADAISAEVALNIATVIKTATDGLYSEVLEATQDYLRENTQFNLQGELDAARRTALYERQRSNAAVTVTSDLLTALKQIDAALVHGMDDAKTSLDRKRAMDRAVTLARTAIAKAKGETA